MAAHAKANNSEQRERIDTLIACFDFLGLTCVHHRYFKNITDNEDLRQLYMDRYDAMFNYIKNHNMDIFSDQSETAVYKMPTSISYNDDPMFQFYGEERNGVTRYP